MTWTLKLRGAVGCDKSTEFECDDCGVFDVAVGDTVASMPCPDCGADSSRLISAPHPKVVSMPVTAVTRGGDMSDRPPGMLDTRPLAEGMPVKEWKKLQAKATQERRHKQLVAKGLKQKRIQVG